MLTLANPSPQQLPMSMTPVEMDLQQDNNKQQLEEQKILPYQSGPIPLQILTWLILKVTKLLYKEMPCTGNVSKTWSETNWIFTF